MNIFIISGFVALLAVFGILMLGLFSMVKGGAFNEKHGNKLMRLRIILQGVALAMFALAYFTSK